MKFTRFFILIVSLILAISVTAQEKPGADFYAGKWKVLLTGTPYGDLNRVYILEKKESGLGGQVLDASGKEIAKFTKVELKDGKLEVYYQSLGNDVKVSFSRKDDDHIEGQMLDYFTAKGERIK